MNKKYIEDISFPCFIIEVKNRRIHYINDAMKNLFMDFYGEKDKVEKNLYEIMNIIFNRIGDNDAVTFSYDLLSEGMKKPLKYRCQYIESENCYIQVIVYSDLSNYIAPVDLSIFTEIIPSGLMLVEITKDNDYIAKYVNAGLHKMLGYSRKECEQYFSHDILKFIHPDDVQEGLRLYYKQIEETGSFSLKGRLTHKNGEHIVVSFVGRLTVDMDDKKWLYCSVTDITQTQQLLEETFEERQVYSVIENVSKHTFFKYEIHDKKISFYGFSLRDFLNKSFAEYNVEEILKTQDINNEKFETLFLNIENCICEPQTIAVENINKELRWLTFKYDFIYDRNGHAVSAIGQIEDITQQMQARLYYDKAIALWSIDQNCDTQVAINLTENTVVDGRSLIFSREKLLSNSAEQYFLKAYSVMVDSPEKQRLIFMTKRDTLIECFNNNELRLQFDVEMNINLEHRWMRVSIELLENPLSKSIIALMKWKNINDVKLQKEINRLLIADTYDFTCCIFAKTDSYLMVENIENNNLLPHSVSGGYGKFMDSIIERYSDSDEKDYLRYCFSIKNLTNQLKINSKYTFVGHGAYPDGTPAIKLHEFMYLNKKKGIILYSRKDITNQGNFLSFKMDGTLYHFEFDEVLYIESFGRKCEITTVKGVYTANENITSIQNRLPGKTFTRCHRSYIVNARAIQKIEKNYIQLSNGKEIPANRQSITFLKNKIEKQAK